ncbi:hypothetical protein [Neptunicella marina]|uniref:Uncharacterized protein n=1 Tax=Neptunicella marina TaxID=2125989 RepID=A0A8J6M4N1_9ALTE|nr:hypothetical protein [Neptunicella marina]MBC3766161.1 hypothetical protein [Neptunicella marina]
MSFSSISLEAIQRVHTNRKRMVQALIFPFIALVVVDLLQGLEPKGAMAMALNILGMLINTLFAVTTHRIILIGDHAVPPFGLSRWTKRETSFLLHTLAFALIFMPFVLVGMFATSGFWVLIPGLICISWLAARLSLVFPAIAIEDENAGFKLAWELSRGKTGFMLAVVFLLPVISIVISYPLLILPGTDAIASMLGTIILVYEVAILSLAYESLSQKHSEHIINV